MDAQILAVVAQLSPQQRIAFAQAQGIPPQVLHQLEQAAVQAGLELTSGSVFAEGDEEGEGVEEEDASAGLVSLPGVFSMTRDKAWAYGTQLAFFLAVPALLYIIKERRGLTWRALVESTARLPFSD